MLLFILIASFYGDRAAVKAKTKFEIAFEGGDSYTKIGDGCLHFSIYLLIFIVGLALPPISGYSKERPFTFENHSDWPTPKALRVFFVDGLAGDDKNVGTTPDKAWRSLNNISSVEFQSGDQIFFKRGSKFTGCLTLRGDGTKADPIVVSAFGRGAAPKFSNPDAEHCNGNVLQLRGKHQIIQNLHFHNTAPAEPNSGFEEVWATGAVHIGLNSPYAIIRGNRFEATPKAIQSYGEFSVISHNYIDGTNMSQQGGFLSKPYWGPIGIHLGIGNQRVAHNRIENMVVQGGEWGGDGGAIEIDDGRYHKNNIHIHHNFSQNNMGFLEISWDHDVRKRATHNIIVEHNISRDYQDFVLWWAENSNSRINNNTIIRTEQIDGMFTDTVFWLDGEDIDITENIIVISDDTEEPLFQGDHADNNHHTNNLYWNIDDGDVDLGISADSNEFTGNPMFRGFLKQDYRLKSGSPATGLGAWAEATDIFDSQAKGLKRHFTSTKKHD